MRPSFLVTGAGLLVAALLVTVAPTPTLAAPATSDRRAPIRWLALGDSYSAGEGTTVASPGCARSTLAYAPLAHSAGVLSKVGVEKQTFYACSGAVTRDPLRDQPQPAAPSVGGFNDVLDQLEKADPKDGEYDLITLTIGGNDIGFPNVLAQCVIPRQMGDGLLAPWSHGCTDREVDIKARVLDLAIERLPGVYERLDRLLKPGGRIVVLTYPILFADPSTWPFPYCEGIEKDDARMLNRVGVELDDSINSAWSRMPDVDVVDVREDFADHGLCSLDPWINGIVSTGIELLVGIKYRVPVATLSQYADLVAGVFRDVTGGNGGCVMNGEAVSSLLKNNLESATGTNLNRDKAEALKNAIAQLEKGEYGGAALDTVSAALSNRTLGYVRLQKVFHPRAVGYAAEAARLCKKLESYGWTAQTGELGYIPPCAPEKPVQPCLPVGGMALGQEVIPGGVWISPANNFEATGDRFRLAARAYPTKAGDPSIDYVNFTFRTPSTPWAVACQVRPASGRAGDTYECDWTLPGSVPSGPVTISFDVYDIKGNRNLAPNGLREGTRRSMGGTPSVPSSPSALQGYGTSPSTIRLQWNDNSANESSFQIENAAGESRDVPPSSNSSTGFDWTGVASDRTMCFRIRAVNAAGASPWHPATASVCGTTKPAEIVDRGSWSSGAPIPTPRRFPAVTSGLDGRIYVIGGTSPITGRLVEAYTPATNRWQVLAPMPTERGEAAAVTDRTGHIFVFGGGMGGSDASTAVEVYTPATNSWATAAPMPRSHPEADAAAGPDGRIYVIDDDGIVDVYTPESNSWAAAAPMPDTRTEKAAAAGSDGRIYVVGDVNCTPESLCSRVTAYNPRTDRWSTVAPMPSPRWALVAATASDGRLYAIGGNGGETVVEAYTPASNNWTVAAPLPRDESDFGGTTGRDGRIYTVGLDGALQIFTPPK